MHQVIHLTSHRLHFTAHCEDAMFAWGKLCLPIAYVYMSFILRSIFLALNMVMHWQYQGKDITELPDEVVGFVYQITNTTNGRMYLSLIHI